MDTMKTAVWLSTALVSILVVFAPTGWRYARYGVTMAHELGHATMATITFSQIHGIHLHKDSSGHTDYSRTVKIFPIGIIASTFSGYTFPILAGLVIAALSLTGNNHIALWSLLSMGILVLVYSRTLFTILISGIWSFLAGLGFFFVPMVAWYIPLMASYLIFAGFKDLVLLYGVQREDASGSNDLHSLEGRSGLHRIIWYVLMWMFSIAYVVLFFYFIVSYFFA